MDSLPMQFVSSMQILFNILDDKHTGYVNLTDIKRRWRHDRTKDLPRGVIESLQKVASHDGKLSFENFCTGLKICLLHNQVDRVDSSRAKCTSSVIRTQSTFDKNIFNDKENNWKHLGNTPQHKQPISQNVQTGTINDRNLQVIKEDYFHRDNREHMSEIERNHRLHTKDKNDHIRSLNIEQMSQKELNVNRGLADGKSAFELQLESRRNRRFEPRRHTLHNGIDYNLIKRMKQIEQEKELLSLGLKAVEEARDWYVQQLEEVQEKMRYAGRMGAYMEPWSEAHQERLELLKVRILEINRQLQALGSGWRHGQLSLHMNLAVTSNVFNHSSLRSQNQ